MTDHLLPHDPYFEAVGDALTAAGLEPGDHSWTSNSETRGTYCYLNAVITLDPSDTVGKWPEDIPDGTPWRYGLLLIWEWHTGREADQGEPERGPVWKFAELRHDGSTEYPTDLPVHGYASPAAVVDAARKVVAREIQAGSPQGYGQWQGWTGGIIGGSWEHADQLETACATWDKQE